TLSVAALIFALVFAAPAAQAHAHLQSSDPAANATVAASPAELRLTFTEPVVAKFAKVTLTDGTGKEIATAAAAADPQNPKQIVVQLTAPLPAGEYHVKWHAVAEDTHPMDGTYAFRIKP